MFELNITIIFLLFITSIPFIIIGNNQILLCQYPAEINILNSNITNIYGICNVTLRVKEDNMIFISNKNLPCVDSNITYIGCYSHNSPKNIQMTPPQKAYISYNNAMFITIIGYIMIVPFGLLNLFVLCALFASILIPQRELELQELPEIIKV